MFAHRPGPKQRADCGSPPVSLRKAACPISVTSNPGSVPLRYGSPAWARGRRGNCTNLQHTPLLVRVASVRFRGFETLPLVMIESWMRAAERGSDFFFSFLFFREEWEGIGDSGGPNLLLLLLFLEMEWVGAGLAARNRLHPAYDWGTCEHDLRVRVLGNIQHNFRYKQTFCFFRMLSIAWYKRGEETMLALS